MRIASLWYCYSWNAPSLCFKEILLILRDSSSVLLVLVLLWDTDPISFIEGFGNIKYAYKNIEDVHHSIQDFDIQTNAKFSVYLTQRNFCKQGLLIVYYSTLIAFNYTPIVMLWSPLKGEGCYTIFWYLSFILSFGLPSVKTYLFRIWTNVI